MAEPCSSDEVVELMRIMVAQNDAIIVKLAALPAAIAAAIEQRRTPRRLSPADEEALAAFLPIVTATVGSRAFTVRELTEHARLSTQLQNALSAIGRPRRIGRLLRRSERIAIEGLRVHCVGKDAWGLLWMVK